MSDYHILTQDAKQKTVQVVFHISVPAAGTNEAGLTWREAVVKEQGGAANITSILPDISTQEDSALKAGELIEQIETVRFSSTNLTNQERKTQIEAAFAERKAELIAEKQITLAWIGFAADIS